MHASNAHPEIKNPGKLTSAGSAQFILTALLGVGLLATVAGGFSDPKRLWPAFLHNHFFFLSLAVGGLFLRPFSG